MFIKEKTSIVTIATGKVTRMNTLFTYANQSNSFTAENNSPIIEIQKLCF